MSYKGYRVKIEGTEIPNMLIAAGSYSFSKSPRVANSWNDGFGVKHEDYHATDKANIAFSIRERKLQEQESIKGIFQKQKKVTVEYWDDYECAYKEGVFKMSGATIGHKNALNNEILYKATQIRLEEY